MLQRLIEDIKIGTGNALRLTTLAAAAAFSLLVTSGFVCAALFVFVLERRGPVVACLAGAAVFLVIGLIAAGCYALQKNQAQKRLQRAAKEAAQSAKSTASTIFSDPAMLAIGLQLVRTVGMRRLLPLLAIGGVAFGVMTSLRDKEGRQAPSAGQGRPSGHE